MMENLLKNEFTVHYGLPVSTITDITKNTDELYFEIEDNKDSKNTVLHTTLHSGEARYFNPERLSITIINYELFFKSLSFSFQKNKENCDLILYTSDNQYFILNELTDTQPQYVSDFLSADRNQRRGKRNKAISQLKRTLEVITVVPEIDSFIKQHTTKQCFFFNKQPKECFKKINAVSAFNRVSALSSDGFKMSNTDIESYGFELWEFSGAQTYKLKGELSNRQIIAEQLAQLSIKDLKNLAEILQSNDN
ncbi:hypothetical protein Barb6_02906 [Bacteroidales bacterium Barb6]|nr:hypothetical protein Barb6_02906 [Bacteroidales bacterium Barb6]